MKMLRITILLGCGVACYAQAPVTCGFVQGVPPIVRAEGLTEPLQDLILQCVGGTPTPADQVVPQYTITVLLSTNATSRLIASSRFSEALLFVDEPNSPYSLSGPILNCGNAGAADSGPSGPGVCSIRSTGNPVLNYDGTPNGWGSATCDGASGRPVANNYGCGRPNIFQGRIGTPSDPSQQNAITFSVPVDWPGAGGARRFRITNLRGDAAQAGMSTGFYANVITASVAFQGSSSVSIASPLQLVGYVQQGIYQTTVTSTRIRISEGFASAWRDKNISFYVGDHNGTAGNATFSPPLYYPIFNGGTNYPNDVAQNAPPGYYSNESGFEWQNNTANGPPIPNPPAGVYSDLTLRLAPSNRYLASLGLGGLNTGITNAGVASAGTRIAVIFPDIPAGGSVQVPEVLYLFRQAATPIYNGDPTQYQPGAIGVMVRTYTDASGAGPYSRSAGPLTLTSTNNTAVYEILWADPFSLEFTEIPYSVSNAANLQVVVRPAPFYPASGANQASASLPAPRFVNGVCPNEACLVVSPNATLLFVSPNGPMQLSLTSTPPTGPNLVGAQMLLRASGVPDIAGIGLSNPDSNTLSLTVDLTNAPAGARDVVVTPRSGPTVVLPRAFGIIDAPACTFSANLGGPVSALGGQYTLSIGADTSVGADPTTCHWSAGTSADWITLGTATEDSTNPVFWSQLITIQANPTTNPRVASIAFPGGILVVQQYAQVCNYIPVPSQLDVPAQGGTATFTVTNPSGCIWPEVHHLPWISGVSVLNGVRDGYASYTIAANSGVPRAGTVMLAGQSLIIKQGGVRTDNVGTFVGQWALDVNGTGAFEVGQDKVFNLGLPDQKPFVGDWNGDGHSKAAVYSNGYWFIDYNGDGVWDGGVVDKQIAWGWPGAIPVVGDWNGDGRTKIGVYSNGFWFLDYNGDYLWDGGVVDKQIGWGWVGATPIVGDWNGDGRTKIGVYSNGFWFLDYDGDYIWDGGVVDKQVGWGWPGVSLVVGDWNGDGRTKIGVYSGGYWYLDYDGNYLWEYPAKDKIWQLGWTGTTPVMGDWNGDGRTKAGAFINGFWYLDYNGNGVFDGSPTDRIYAFGTTGDAPVFGHW